MAGKMMEAVIKQLGALANGGVVGELSGRYRGESDAPGINEAHADIRALARAVKLIAGELDARPTEPARCADCPHRGLV